MRVLGLIHRFTLVIAVVLATALGGSPGFAQSLSPEPTIRDVRLGFNRVYKLGCWTPIEIELVGGTKAYTGHVLVTAPDSDGVPTTVRSDRPIGVDPGETTFARLLVRVGQSNSALHVRFVADGSLRSERKFYVGPELASGVVPGGIAATCRVLLEFGPALGLGEVVQTDEENNETTATKVVRIEHAKELPTHWIGYEGIDTVLLVTSEPELYRPLLQNPGRIASLRRWVELGGKLVVFCSAEAEELLAADGPLAELVPGTYAEMLPLQQWLPLETFSGAEPDSRNKRFHLRVPKLKEVRGQILAHAGRRPTDLPLVVRSYLGLGELVFVGLDFDRPPLRDWPGRVSFLRKVFHGQEQEHPGQPSGNRLAVADSNDMIGQVRSALDKQFVGVEVVPFVVVALLVVGYIALIGPGDYYLVRKVFGRPEFTWLTFPLIVIGMSAAAYWYANWKKGDQLRVNQIEVVDVDTTGGSVRGTVWTHFFTPRVDTYDFTFKPHFLDDAVLEDTRRQVSWLGLPGYALGGMQASASQTSVFNSGYTYDPLRESMQDVPVQVWSTKTITARWTANVGQTISADLHRTSDGLVTGQFENLFDMGMEDCALLYGRWAYNIGRLAEGATVTLDHSRQPRTVKTHLTSATAGDETITNTADDGTVPFRLARADVARLVKSMMFFEATGGRRYTGKFNRYQSFIDLSHLLQQEDRAILLARSPASGSQWLDDGQPFGSDKDRRWIYYRFVLPVDTTAE